MKRALYRRFDVHGWADEYGQHEEEIDRSDGKYVLAEDAINREAVLQDEIKTLRAQLRNDRPAMYSDGFRDGVAQAKEGA